MARPARQQRRAPQRKRQNGARSRADRQLAQGVGRAVAKPFLASPQTISLRGWDAFDTHHTPLPRATGPYAVVRTSNLFSSTAKFTQFGSFKSTVTDTWSNVVGVSSVVNGTAINAGSNVKIHTVPLPGGNLVGSGLTMVPAAISVQVLNGEALQTTTGIMAAGVCHTQMDLNDRTETWNDVSTEFISYFRPRMMSAGKLALRGVQMNAYPLNMSALADFRPYTLSTDGAVTTYNGSAIAPEGFSPIVIVNNSGVTLQYLVSVEWRVRFDLGSPAVASHTHHGVTPDGSWNRMLTAAISLGNGVLDIVERVASAGQAAEQIAALANRARPLALTL